MEVFVYNENSGLPHVLGRLKVFSSYEKAENHAKTIYPKAKFIQNEKNPNCWWCEPTDEDVVEILKLEVE